MMDLPNPFPDWQGVPPDAQAEHLHHLPDPLSGEQPQPQSSREGVQGDDGIVRTYLPDGRLHMVTDAYGTTTVFTYEPYEEFCVRKSSKRPLVFGGRTRRARRRPLWGHSRP